MAATQTLSEPDPLRLAYRDVIKAAVREVVTSPSHSSAEIIERCLGGVESSERDAVSSMVEAELQRLHEGVLARYGLRPSEYAEWRSTHRGRHQP